VAHFTALVSADTKTMLGDMCFQLIGKKAETFIDRQ